jgi:hypothetical protein
MAILNGASDKQKIDSFATDGLTGVSNSLAYRTHEIERHLHHWERWFGLAAVPDAEVHRADSIVDNVAPFQADGGNDTWGSWLQVLGSSDTPAITGSAYYDLHQIDVVAAERANTTYLIQIALGASGAAALTAGDYSELVFHPQSVQGRPAPLTFQARRVVVTTKAWVRILARGQNTGTMDFYVGLHEYEG